MCTTFALDEAGGSFSALCSAGSERYVYTRWANPTVHQLEEKLASLDGGEMAVAFGTGMGAAAGLLLHRLAAGDHLVVSDVTYAGVAELARDTLTKLRVEVTTADLSDLDDLGRAMRPNTRMIWVLGVATRARGRPRAVILAVGVSRLARSGGDGHRGLRGRRAG